MTLNACACPQYSTVLRRKCSVGRASENANLTLQKARTTAYLAYCTVRARVQKDRMRVIHFGGFCVTVKPTLSSQRRTIPTRWIGRAQCGDNKRIFSEKTPFLRASGHNSFSGIVCQWRNDVSLFSPSTGTYYPKDVKSVGFRRRNTLAV